MPALQSDAAERAQGVDALPEAAKGGGEMTIFQILELASAVMVIALLVQIFKKLEEIIEVIGDSERERRLPPNKAEMEEILTWAKEHAPPKQ